MSNKLVNLVDQARIGDVYAKTVLRKIADQSNDVGTGVWSSHGYIAWCTEMGRDTVLQKCQYLHDLGILNWERRHGTSNLYELDVDTLVKLVPEEGYNGKVAVVENILGCRPDQQGVLVPPTPDVGPADTSPSIVPIEPTYVPDNGDGVPFEHVMVYHDILEVWAKKFPNKRQPQPANVKMQRKVKARLKVPTFKARLWEAMLKAAASPSLVKDSWFQLEYLLRNDDNYEKVASGEFDWKDQGSTQAPTPTSSNAVWKDRLPPFPGE
jgi:hypothetical protein